MALVADPSWMLAVVPEGLIALSSGTQIEVALDAPFEQRHDLLGLLADGVDSASLAALTGADRSEADELLARLQSQSLLVEEPAAEAAPEQGVPLIDALLGLERDGALAPICWTAEEVLCVPAGLDSWRARRVMRAFVSGLVPDERLAAYGYAARWSRASVRGDRADPAPLREVLAAELDPEAAHVLDLRGGVLQSVPVDALDRLCGESAQRLGPVPHTSVHRNGDTDGVVMCSARYAAPNLRHPPKSEGSIARGTADTPEQAELVARAEAVERYASGDVAAAPIIRAQAVELAGAISPEVFFALNARQREAGLMEPYDPAVAYLWTPASAPDGSRRWVAAEQVFFPFDDPERDGRLASAVTSSGVAAHSTFDEARLRAFCELVERDAFMWTWIQRIARERLDKGSLPPELGRRIKDVERSGYRVELVNLTLDSWPVILCLARDEHRLSMGAACHREPARAVAKALDEATVLIGHFPPPQLDSDRLEDVSSPREHLALHHRDDLREEHAFLVSSPETVELADVAAPEQPIEALLGEIGEPLTIDLSSGTTRPFHVVRALVPELVPISFGWDREPLGMPRLAQPITTIDGRRLGRGLDLETIGPLLPHPFP